MTNTEYIPSPIDKIENSLLSQEQLDIHELDYYKPFVARLFVGCATGTYIDIVSESQKSVEILEKQITAMPKLLEALSWALSELEPLNNNTEQLEQINQQLPMAKAILKKATE